jgi:hypothetical protein
MAKWLLLFLVQKEVLNGNQYEMHLLAGRFPKGRNPCSGKNVDRQKKPKIQPQ